MTNVSESLPYRDRRLTPRQRAADLLSRMALEEKAAQMLCVWNEKKGRC